MSAATSIDLAGALQRRAWVPVVASGRLAAGAVLPLLVERARCVVWRSRGGHALVWDDRCPHRGMRLSFGAVGAHGLACPYHGWRFDVDARCNLIPAHPQARPTASAVVAFAVAEHDGYVWMRRLAADVAEPPPALPEATPVRSLHVPQAVETVLGAIARGGLGVLTGSPSPADLAPGAWLRGAMTTPEGSVPYAVTAVETGAGECMVHLAALGPCATRRARALDRALVALRDRLALDPADALRIASTGVAA